MRLRAFAVLLLLVSASAPAANEAASIALSAQDGPSLDAPFRPPVVFTLRPDANGTAYWEEAGDEDFLASVARWQIQIYDFDGRKVDYVQGLGPPASASVPWDAVGRDGRPLRDAFYTARFVWQDAGGANHASEPIKVGLLTPPGLQDFVGPQVRLSYTADGLVIRLAENLTFEAGEWAMKPEAAETLDHIADFLRLYPDHRLLIQGHTDTTGSARFNKMISLRRSRTIYDYLVRRGVGEERIVTEGLGASRPLASNATPEGRRRNRRVEIVLLKAVI